MNNKFTLLVLLFFAMIGALFLGSTIGQARYVDLSMYGIIIAVVVYVVYLYRFTWQIVLFIYASGMRFNFGFAITSTHVTVLMLFVYGVILWGLRKNPLPRPVMFDRININRFVFVLGVLILYGIFSFTLNKVAPYTGGEGEYATKSMLKGYFDGFGPSLFLIVALLMPYSFKISERVMPSILLTIFLGAAINMIHLIYLYKQGFGGAVDAIDAVDGQRAAAFYIPLINASFGPMTLRGIGPTAVMFSFAAIAYPGWFRSQTLFVKLIALGVFVIGMAGAIMSGGRVALIMALFFLFFISVIYRRMLMIFASISVGVLVITIANIFSSYINTKLPTFVARPMQYIMIEKGDAMDTIQNSSDHRSALYYAALDEWRSDPRIILLGRSVYVSPNLDDERGRSGSLGAFIKVNVMSGTAHALVPSALLQFGLVGTFLYYIVYIAMIRYFWKVYKTTRRGGYSEELKILSLLFTVAFSVGLVVATIGGGWFGAYQILMVVLVKSMASRDEMVAGIEQASREAMAPQPVRGGVDQGPFRPQPIT